MDQELVPDQDMPSDDSFEQAVRDEGDVADTAATEIKTARSKESKKTGGENMEALVEGGRSVKVARLHEAPASFAKSKQSDCTAKVTDYAVTNYNETMKSVSALLNQTHYDLHEVPIEELPERLARFFMSVKRKRSNKSLNASSLGTIYTAIGRYLSEDHPLKIDIKTDPRFKVVKKNLMAAQKESCEEGEAPGKHKMEPVQEQHIIKCWEDGSLGRDSPRSLIRTVHLYLMTILGFRANKEVANLRNEDIVMGAISLHDVPEKITVSERVTKTRQGQANQVRDIRPIVWADHENPDRCPVRAFVEYERRKTEVQKMKDQRFMLNVKQSAEKNPAKEDKWYATSPMSCKEISKLLPGALKEVGVDTKKEHLSNTSLRKGMMETLVGAHVPATLVRQMAGHASEKSMQSYVEGGSKAKEAASLIMSRTMGGRKAEKFGKTVSEVEGRASTDLINTSRPSAAASSSSPTTTEVGSSSSPTPHSGSLNNTILAAHGHEILTSPSPAALPSVQQPLPSPIFPGPAPGFHPSFDPKMLLAQQQPLLGINSHLGTMVPVQQPILQPFPTAFVQSSPYPLFPSHQVGSSTSYQLAQQIDIINQKHSAQLEEQKRIFERQLQKRDEQLDKILKGMERNVNPEQIPRYEIYCNVRQGFVIHNFSGPLKLKRPWVTLSTTRTSAIPGMK